MILFDNILGVTFQYINIVVFCTPNLSITKTVWPKNKGFTVTEGFVIYKYSLTNSEQIYSSSNTIESLLALLEMVSRALNLNIGMLSFLPAKMSRKGIILRL